MEPFEKRTEAEKLLSSIRTEENNIRDYFIIQLQHLKPRTQINHLISLSKLFQITGKNDGRKINKEDILNLMDSKWFNSLKESSKKIYLTKMRIYLKFSFQNLKKEHPNYEILKILNNKIKGLRLGTRELTKEDLISRNDLNILIKHVKSFKLKTLIMILYESALRKSELLGITLKDITFEDNLVKIKVMMTKRKNRKPKQKIITLLESVPYIKEWINRNDFKSEDYIFKYENEGSLNVSLHQINNQLKLKYPKKWTHDKLYPHLARHSRITELYKFGHFNDELMRKFAGWESGSAMTGVYSHLVDSDVENALAKSWGIKQSKEKEIININHPKICPYCKNENNLNNTFCWKCKNILDETKSIKEGLNIIKGDNQIEELKQEIRDLKLLQLNELTNIRIEFNETLKKEFSYIQSSIPPDWRTQQKIQEAEMRENQE